MPLHWSIKDINMIKSSIGDHSYTYTYLVSTKKGVSEHGK